MWIETYVFGGHFAISPLDRVGYITLRGCGQLVDTLAEFSEFSPSVHRLSTGLTLVLPSRMYMIIIYIFIYIYKSVHKCPHPLNARTLRKIIRLVGSVHIVGYTLPQ